MTTLSPDGKERMRRLVLSPLVTRRFKLEQIEQAYELFADQRDVVLKITMMIATLTTHRPSIR